jgi:hypothetical protein
LGPQITLDQLRRGQESKNGYVSLGETVSTILGKCASAGADAQADLATLQKMNPTLAKELAEVMETGKEEDRVYGLSTRIRQSSPRCFMKRF